MTPAKSPTSIIANIYAYALLAGSVVVLAIGVYMLAKNLLGRYVLDQYPLGYEETRCDYISSPYMPMPVDGTRTPDQMEQDKQRYEEESKKAKAECEQQLVELRARKQNTDFYESLVLLVVGTLIFVPHVIFAYRLRR
jgi:hypothetical protein